MTLAHPDYGVLQHLIDTLYKSEKFQDRLTIILTGELFDLNDDLMELLHLLPPGRYPRQQLCDQLNSALSGHGWGMVYGTVE